MTKSLSLRLKRLGDTQQRLRTLAQLDLARCRDALTEAEAQRDHVLKSVSGGGSADQAWMVARTDASRRTKRHLDVAVTGVVDQAARLRERAAVGLLIERLHCEARRQESARREARELAETLERVAVAWDDSAGQD